MQQEVAADIADGQVRSGRMNSGLDRTTLSGSNISRHREVAGEVTDGQRIARNDFSVASCRVHEEIGARIHGKVAEDPGRHASLIAKNGYVTVHQDAHGVCKLSSVAESQRMRGQWAAGNDHRRRIDRATILVAADDRSEEHT